MSDADVWAIGLAFGVLLLAVGAAGVAEVKARARKPTVAEQLAASAVFRVALDELAAVDERDAVERPYARRGVVLDLSSSPPRVAVFSIS